MLEMYGPQMVVSSRTWSYVNNNKKFAGLSATNFEGCENTFTKLLPLGQALLFVDINLLYDLCKCWQQQ